MSRPQASTRTDYAFVTNITTRWSDNDIYGHVNNVTYYSYFDTVANSKIDKSTKVALYKHYVAIMVDSEALKMNQLYLQGTPVKSLKQY